MSTAELTIIAGNGTNQASFSGPMLGLNLAGFSGGGRTYGLAVGPDGDIYVAATFAQVVGRLDAPSKWQQQSLAPGFTVPLQALAWKVISTINIPLHTLSAVTQGGQPAVRWQSPSVPANTWLYAVPGTLAGATINASVTLAGTGTVYLDFYDGTSGGDAVSETVSLTGTPQTLTSPPITMTAGNPEFQIRTPTAQTGIDLTVLAATVAQSAVTGTAHAIAGVFSVPGFSGDSRSGDSTQLNFPSGVTVAADGTVYIADTYNNRIRRAGADGRITTVAGTGQAGFSGDGGKATAARVNLPGDVTVAADGTLYVADTYNNRIRAVSARGQIRTIAGTGQAGFSGDGGPAVAAALNHPSSIAVAATGIIYVADTYNNRVRAIATDGTVTTVAGTGTAGYGGDGGPASAAALFTPQGVAVDGLGNIYIADTLNHRVRAITPDGTITTVAGTGVFGKTTGVAASSELAEPTAVAVTASGSDLYIAQGSSPALLRVTGLTLDDPKLTVDIQAPVFTGSGQAAITVTVTNAGPLTAQDVGVDLAVPPGWAAQPAAPVSVGDIAKAGSASATWQVTPAASAVPLTKTTLTSTASYSYGSPAVQDSASADLVTYVQNPLQAPMLAYASATPVFFGQSGSEFAIATDGADVQEGTGDQYGAIYLPGAAGLQATVVVKVESQDNTNVWAKAGIMIRDDMTKAGASLGYAIVAVTPGRGVAFQWDGNGNGFLDGSVNTGSVQAPVWLKMVRDGTTFTGYYSTDNSTWSEVSSATVPGSQDAEDVGVFMCSHAPGTVGLATFSGLQITSP